MRRKQCNKMIWLSRLYLQAGFLYAVDDKMYDTIAMA